MLKIDRQSFLFKIQIMMFFFFFKLEVEALIIFYGLLGSISLLLICVVFLFVSGLGLWLQNTSDYLFMGPTSASCSASREQRQDLSCAWNQRHSVCFGEDGG